MAQTERKNSEFFRYRRDIDGLRAVAVSLVVFYHAFPTILTGGFIGVDVFFVISGYLISGIIFDSLDRGQFSFVLFYGRRIRRIFPALFLVLLSCLGYGFVVLLPSELATVGKDVAGGAGFVSNLLLWNEAGYFDRGSTSKPLLHLWSLGIEEQFYIFWPLILWGAWRCQISRFGLMVIIIIASLILNIFYASTDITADFYSPVSRSWELLSGAMLASFQLRRKNSYENSKIQIVFLSSISVLGLVLIIGSALLFNPELRFPGWLAVFPVLGAVMLLATGPSGLVNHRFLSNRFSVFIGLISYPLYLWHWPLLSYAYILQNGQQPKSGLAFALVLVSVLLAWLTYVSMEKPLRFGAKPTGATLLLLVAVAIAGMVGAVTWYNNGFAQRFISVPALNIAKINAAIKDGIFKPTKDMKVQIFNKICVSQIGSGTNSVLFTGDSVLYQYGPRVQHLFLEGRLRKTVYFVTGASCAPVPGVMKTGLFSYCSSMSALSDQLIATKNIKTVIIGAFWQGYIWNRKDQRDEIFIDRAGTQIPLDSQDAVNSFYENLEDEVRRLVASHHQVFLVLSVPAGPQFDPLLMIKRSVTGFSIEPGVLNGTQTSKFIDAAASINQRLIGIAQRTGAFTINPMLDICGTGSKCLAFFDDGEPKFSDNMHLRPIFVEKNIHVFDDILTR